MRLSPLEMLGLLMRRTSISKMRRALTLLDRYQLDISKAKLEVHILAGGDIERVLGATAAARDAGLGNKFSQLAAADLEGEDLAQFVARGFVSEQAIRRRELEARAASDPSARNELRGLLQKELHALDEEMRKVRAIVGLPPEHRGRILDELSVLQAHYRDRLEGLTDS